MVGVPMVTSTSNLQFWLQLCSAASLPETTALVNRFKIEASSPDDFSTFLRAYNRDLIQQVSHWWLLQECGRSAAMARLRHTMLMVPKQKTGYYWLTFSEETVGIAMYRC